VVEQRSGLGGIVDHLDEDDALDGSAGHGGPQLAESEIAPDGGVRRQPAVVVGLEVPDVHVRVH
jgi:hypothetical protein